MDAKGLVRRMGGWMLGTPKCVATGFRTLFGLPPGRVHRTASIIAADGER